MSTQLDLDQAPILHMNNVQSVVTGVPDELAWLVSKAFSIMTPGARFNKAVQERLWDGRVRFFNADNGVFLTGFAPFILQSFAEHECPLQINDLRTIPEMSWADPRLVTIPCLRSFQADAIKILKASNLAATSWLRGVIHHPTGLGKTALAMTISKSLGLRTIFLVDRRDLLYQAHEAFEEELGSEIGIIGDGNYNVQSVTISTFQSLLAIFRGSDVSRKLQVMETLKQAQVLFIDECHRTQGKDFRKIVDLCHANVRIGLSATVFEKPSLMDWNIIGATGGLLHRVTAREAWESGDLAEPLVTPVEVLEPKDVDVIGKEVYNVCVVTNEVRNAWIIKKAIELASHGHPTLIMVTRLAHGKLLRDMFNLAGVKVRFLHGNTPRKKRKQEVERSLASPLPIILASQIFSTGINIPTLRDIINAAGGASWILVKQLAGRGMRKKEGENKVRIYDFLDLMHPKMQEHSRERMETYFREEFPFGKTLMAGE